MKYESFHINIANIATKIFITNKCLNIFSLGTLLFSPLRMFTLFFAFDWSFLRRVLWVFSVLKFTAKVMLNCLWYKKVIFPDSFIFHQQPALVGKNIQPITIFDEVIVQKWTHCKKVLQIFVSIKVKPFNYEGITLYYKADLLSKCNFII